MNPTVASRIPRAFRRAHGTAALLAAVLGVSGPAAGGPPLEMTTRAYLDLPELFQLSVISGSMAVLRRWADESGDLAARECYQRWRAAEDVQAIVLLDARRHPEALNTRFADTLIAALTARCHSLTLGSDGRGAP